jgi:Heparinase II/III-like protein/Heparinase II/III N-terminus
LNFSRFPILFKALRELGAGPLGLYGLYQLQLHSGVLEGRTQAATAAAARKAAGQLCVVPLTNLPERQSLEAVCGPDGVRRTLAEAEEIVAGQVRLFGGPPVLLELRPPGPLLHWSAYEKGRPPAPGGDVKWVWEAGRFGWAYSLGRAYRLCADERYPQAFWSYAEAFWQANPPYRGPHWLSAQEAALRLMALVFAGQVFAGSPHSTAERAAHLAGSIAEHAARIPPSLAYARAQNNNHLLSEAAGLYTAGMALPEHPQARNWRAMGWKWFHAGLQSQIDGQGAYMQNSANYQRLMLQLALWVQCLAAQDPQVQVPDESLQRLTQATGWMLNLLDPASGAAPNLGPNDGAHILPLASCPFRDYRPTLQAAGQAFLGKRPLESGAWDELALWLAPAAKQGQPPAPVRRQVASAPHVLRHPSLPSWAYLRAARFNGRPGHADQLHVDLWWRGQNLAMDAGTYLYNAAPPWVNSLAFTAVHNTLTINNRNQMTPAGRFLFVDRAQAEVVEAANDRLTARHDGYRRMGWMHQRTVQAVPQGWLVTDKVQPAKPGERPGELVEARLQWLLPDWPWKMQENCLRLDSAGGWVELEVTADFGADPRTGPPASLDSLAIQIVRAGELIYGCGEISPTWGWFSPTYGYKYPALSLGITLRGPSPLVFTSRWRIPQG